MIKDPSSDKPPTTTQTNISNFTLPNNLDITTPCFKIQNPTSNSSAPFIFSSNNINIINIMNNNIAVITGVGTVIITARQNAITGYSSSSVSNTINVNGYANNSVSDTNYKQTYKLSGLDISNYNLFTNILITNYNWNYFKYYTNNNHKISSQINLTTNNDVFSYSKLENSDVYVLYCGSGAAGLSQDYYYCGGGPGEIALTKISSSDINDDTIININFNTNNTAVSYTTKSGDTKSYSVFNGLSGSFLNDGGIGGAGGASKRTGSITNNYNGTLGYNNDTISFGSGSGSGSGNSSQIARGGVYTGNNNGTLFNTRPQDMNLSNHGVLIDFNNKNISSDGTGTITTQYGGSKNNLNGPPGFVLIFYKVNNNYTKISINSNSLYNKLTNATQVFNMYNYNPFNKLLKKNSNWVYCLLTNSDNTSYILKLVNNYVLFEQNNLNSLFKTTSKIYNVSGDINILYIGGGGSGGLAGTNNTNSGGGGASGGVVKYIKQTLNTSNSFHNFEITIGTTGKISNCIYNTNTSVINYGNALQGNNGYNANIINGTGGNGGDGLNIDINRNFLGSVPGGGGDGITPGNSGSFGDNILYYPSINSKRSNSAISVNLNNDLGSILTGWSGFGGSVNCNGENGSPGLCLIYFQVVATN